MLPRASPQPCPLLGSWQACLFSSYGLPKATLGILARLQTLPRASPQPCPLLGRLPKATFRHFGPPSQAFRPLAASLWPVRSFSAAGRPLAASLPPLFLWASEDNVRHFGPASKASRQPAGLLRPLCGLSEACLLSSYGLPKATLGILDRLQTKASRQPAGLLRPLCGLSEACLLSSYGLPKATLGILARLQTLPRASPQPCPLLGSWQACLFSSYGLPKAPEPHRSLALFSAGFRRRRLGILGRLQKLFACPKLLGSRQASCGLSVACPKPASSLLLGFRRQREAFWTGFKSL